MRTPSLRVAVAAAAIALLVSCVPTATARTAVAPYVPHARFTVDTDLLSASGYAAWSIDAYLAATTDLPPLGTAFMQAERRYGLNARYLLAHAMHESAWGTSWIAVVKHNLFGYNAYDRNPGRYATAFRSDAAGIATVARFIRDWYLTPTGRWWGGAPTLRAMGYAYASDRHWAVAVADIATAIDAQVPTLSGLGVRFGTPAPVGDAVAGGSLAVAVPVSSTSGAGLPTGITFAARWSPLAIVGAAASVPTSIPATSSWRGAPRTGTGPAPVATVAVPKTAGQWRLDLVARDEDGSPLPANDTPSIASIAVTVRAQRDAEIDLSATSPVGLGLRLRATGRTAIPASVPQADGSSVATRVVAWSVPLSTAASPSLLASVALASPVARGTSLTLSLPVPAGPALVVAQVVVPAGVSHPPGSAGQVAAGSGTSSKGVAPPASAVAGFVASAPVVAFVDPGPRGVTVVPLAIADPRSDVLLHRSSAPPTPVDVVAGPAGLDARLAADPSAPIPGLSDAGPAGPAQVTVWTLDPALGGLYATATSPLVDVQAGSTAMLPLASGPAGPRLVLAGLVPAGSGAVDPGSLWAGWLDVPALSS